MHSKLDSTTLEFGIFDVTSKVGFCLHWSFTCSNRIRCCFTHAHTYYLHGRVFSVVEDSTPLGSLPFSPRRWESDGAHGKLECGLGVTYLMMGNMQMQMQQQGRLVLHASSLLTVMLLYCNRVVTPPSLQSRDWVTSSDERGAAATTNNLC